MCFGRVKDWGNVFLHYYWLKNQECQKCHEKGLLRRDCLKNKGGKTTNQGSISANVPKDEDSEVYSTLVAAEQLADS